MYKNGSYPNPDEWRYFSARTWLNDTFYNGFSSDIKSRIINIKYNSQGTWYNDDKVILPSCKELNYSGSYTDIEGTTYPIFTNNASRRKYEFGTTGYYASWWTRSRDTGYSGGVWCVGAGGSLGGSGYGGSRYVVPTLRIS